MSEPVQPEAHYVIAALHDELKASQDNRLYLLAFVKKLQAEHEEERALWFAERESLMKGRKAEETEE